MLITMVFDKLCSYSSTTHCPLISKISSHNFMTICIIHETQEQDLLLVYHKQGKKDNSFCA